MRKQTLQFLVCSLPAALLLAGLAGCATEPPASSTVATGRTHTGAGRTSRLPAASGPEGSLLQPGSHAADEFIFPERPRELFQPLVTKEGSRSAGRKNNGRGLSHDPNGKPDVAPRQPGEIPQVAPEDGEVDRPILRGITRQGYMVQAIIEDPEAKLTRTVRAGDKVFGYEVVEIAAESAVLRSDEETLTLALVPGEAPPPIEALSDGLGLGDRRNSPLAELPSHLALTLSRVLPKDGEIVRVRPDTDDGVRLWRVEKRINGLSHEVRIAEDGRILRVEARVNLADVPKVVTAAAEKAVDGYVINTSDTPRFWDRNGRRYYEIEVMRPGTRDEIDLQIAPDGTVLGRD